MFMVGVVLEVCVFLCVWVVISDFDRLFFFANVLVVCGVVREVVAGGFCFYRGVFVYRVFNYFLYFFVFLFIYI